MSLLIILTATQGGHSRNFSSVGLLEYTCMYEYWLEMFSSRLWALSNSTWKYSLPQFFFFEREENCKLICGSIISRITLSNPHGCLDGKRRGVDNIVPQLYLIWSLSTFTKSKGCIRWAYIIKMSKSESKWGGLKLTERKHYMPWNSKPWRLSHCSLV